MDKNRFVAEKLGIKWYEKEFPECGVSNPYFYDDAGAVELLRMIMKSKYRDSFCNCYGCKYNGVYYILPTLITVSGSLLNAVAGYFGWRE